MSNDDYDKQIQRDLKAYLKAQAECTLSELALIEITEDLNRQLQDSKQLEEDNGST